MNFWSVMPTTSSCKSLLGMLSFSIHFSRPLTFGNVFTVRFPCDIFAMEMENFSTCKRRKGGDLKCEETQGRPAAR